MSKYKEYLEYYKRKLERNLKDANTVNYVFEKLNKSEFPVTDLVNTGIYKVVRGISKSGGEFADKALPLYSKWKLLLLAEQGDQTKSLPPQSVIPPPIKVFDTSENYVNNDSSKLFPPIPSDIKNGFSGIFQKNLFTVTDSSSNNRTSYNPSPVNDGALKIKNSATLVQPPVNLFQPFSTFSSTYAVHTTNAAKATDIAPEQNPVSLDYSANFDSQSNHSNAFSSPHSSNSQNPLEIGPSTASPSKIGRIPDPYTIEMKEGMFRVVKCHEAPTPEIVRVRRLYNREEDNIDEDEPPRKDSLYINIEDILKTPIKCEQVAKISKNSKTGSDRSSEKTVHSKSKNQTPDKTNKHKNSSEKISIKLEKVKTVDPHVNKSAMEKSKSEKKLKDGTSSSKKLDKNSPHKFPSKQSSKGSPSIKHSSKDSHFTKSNVKGSPSSMLKIKGSPSGKHSSKGSPSIKPNNKGSPTVKLNNKSSPSVFVNNANSSPCDTKYFNPGHKDCDKKTKKGLTNEAAESFMLSKKERTSIYSGKKALQEVPKLHLCCVKVLRKNFDCIKSTRRVPYEVLKPVLVQCSATQLRRVEENNPYLLEDTDEIWATLCKRKYRDVKPRSPGTWRDLYWRTREVQDQKLKSIAASISASRQKAVPERKIMLTESPERPRSKKIKLLVPDLTLKVSPKESAHNSVKELNTFNNLKVTPTKELAHSKASVKESSSSSTKKAKKASVAPLMSKVKKTISFFAMHKK